MSVSLDMARQEILCSGLARSITVPGFTVQRFRFPGDLALPAHEHELPALVIQLAGGFAGTVKRDSYFCETGDVAVVPAGLSHTETVGPAGSDALLVFPESADRYPWNKKPMTRTNRFHGNPFRRLARKMERELRAGYAASPLVVESALLELASLIFPTPRPRETGRLRWLERVHDYLDAHFAQDITLDGLARSAGVSRTYLARMFRQRYGCSVGDYLRSQRIEQAGRWLACSDKPLAEIALGCGYFDQSHFSNSFRQHFGITPSRYRREASLRLG